MNQASGLHRWLKTFSQRHIISNSIKIALVVGTILNLINQGEQLLAWADISWGSIALNYLIPFSVASYSAVRNQMVIDS